MLVPLPLPPGVYRTGTDYQSKGRFFDADLWRWFEDTQRPVGGWRKKSADPVSGKARAVLTWVDNSNQTWTAVGTNEGLFIYSRAGTLYDITPVEFTEGRADASTGGGYGRGKYGRGAYGTPRPDNTNILPAMVWTLDTWGEILIACDGETIYEWELDTAEVATVLTDGADPEEAAPSAQAIFVTEQGAIVALGAAGDPRKVEWSDPENRNAWLPASTNLAGGFRVQSTGKLVCGSRIRGGAILHTDVDAHLMTYSVGSPDVYDIERMATGSGIISRGGSAVVDSRDYWMGPNNFWIFSGSVQPLPCEVGDYVFGDINRGQASKVSRIHLSRFGEVWWFYPSSTSTECDRYVAYNYRENHWNVGSLGRLCGVDRGVTSYPLMLDADGFLYEHEVGQARDGRQPYAVSGPVELGNGDRTMSVYAVIPDEATLGDVEVSFTTRDWTKSPDVLIPASEPMAKTNCRFNARQVSVKYLADADKDFRVGVFRFDVKPGPPR